ncbi:MAG: LamG-like jellyroll fold domain-containing protein [Bacteroidota bacterium]|nr:LamG-like jellyroll fold domain-containing protein [Bacteroidota bacterium]
MKTKIFSLRIGVIAIFTCFAFIFLFNKKSNAQDTTIVQTLDFQDITKRRGWYVFPSDTASFEKILMYYTLKCDAATTKDKYACGEWDYSTFTRLYEYENTDAPFFVKGTNNAPDSILFSNTAVYSIYQKYQYTIIYDTIKSENDYTLSSGTTTQILPFNTNKTRSKTQYLWTASELLNAGLTAGNIDKMKFDIISQGSEINNLSIKIKHTSLTALDKIETEGFTKVYFKNSSFQNTGLNSINFFNAFSWNGSDNIIVEISFTNANAGSDNTVMGDTTSFNSCISTSTEDSYLSFDGENDYVNCGDIDELDGTTAYTFETWVNIHEWKSWKSILTKAGKISIQTGSKKGSLYCIMRNPNNTYGYKNDVIKLDEWTHLAVTYDGTKSTNAEKLRLFVNGVEINLTYNGSIPTTTFTSDMPLTIASVSGLKADFDDVRIWNTAVSETEINNWMYKELDNLHPNYSSLLVYYPMNTENGYLLTDNSANKTKGVMIGLPQWRNFNGSELLKNSQTSKERPNVTFVQANYISHIDSIITADTIMNSKLSVIEKSLSKDFSGSGIGQTNIDTFIGWEAGNTFTFKPNGEKIISGYKQADQIFRNSYKSKIHQIQNYVTPYGINLNLGKDGFTWIYDVTDYKPWLHDTVDISAGNQQELIDLKFVMIKGTPPRDVVELKTIWRGNYQHTQIADNIALPAVDVKLNPNASQYIIKTRATGHGMGSVSNCSEFCPKYFNLKINGTKEFEWLNWKECAENPVYPQGGTWIYDRAGWCPGSFAKTFNWDISHLVNPGETASIDYGMQAYKSGESGNYWVTVQLISYDEPNFNLDASIVEVISPNKNELYNRINPICSLPKVVIKNTGKQKLTSLTFDFYVKGGDSESYEWTGELDFMEADTIHLPIPGVEFWETDEEKNIFHVEISKPNGGTDEYSNNNICEREYNIPDVFTEKFIFQLKTNKRAFTNSFTIKDKDGNIVFSRTNLENTKVYLDTIDLPDGCYTYELLDGDNDGLSFWARPSSGSGYLRLRDVNTGQTLKTFQNDFGRSIIYDFTVAYETNSLDELSRSIFISAWPNPADKELNIETNGFKVKTISLEIFDLQGKKVLSKLINNSKKHSSEVIDVSSLNKGIYFVKVSGEGILKTEKIVVK